MVEWSTRKFSVFEFSLSFFVVVENNTKINRNKENNFREKETEKLPVKYQEKTRENIQVEEKFRISKVAEKSNFFFFRYLKLTYFLLFSSQ